MAWYRTGTVTVANGSTTVTGAGTAWASPGVKVGYAFMGPDGALYEVGAINTSSEITLTTPYGGSNGSGQTYGIIPTHSLNVELHAAMLQLVQTANQKIDPLDAWLTAREGEISGLLANRSADIDAWLANADANFDSRIPLTPSIFLNGLMTQVTNGVPDSYGYSGVTLEAVHPYTKGFEGPYTATAPSGAASSPDQATEANPYWFGTYNIGSRMQNGGIRNGWGNVSGLAGHIMKITAAPGGATTNRYISFARRPAAARHSNIGFKCWIKLAQGSRVGFGSHSGFGSNGAMGMIVTKAEADAEQDGWKFVEYLASPTSDGTMNPGNFRFMMGFDSDETIEAYMALPYGYIPRIAQNWFMEE